jgi:cold shock CspA family protein
MAAGTVKYFNLQTGKGMLSQDGGEDVPADTSELVGIGADQLPPGRRVQFSIEVDGEGNAKAVNVRPV